MKKSLLALLLFAFVTVNAQVGIGTNSPDASAKLDVTSTNKGFLPPRVALTGTLDVSTITSPATALLVYNTATAGTIPNNVIPGYYYYNGSNWVNLITTATSGVPYTGASGAVNLGAYDLTVNTVTVGLGHGNVTGNTALGTYSLPRNTTAANNTAIGYGTLNSNTGGYNNTALGSQTLQGNTTGNNNTATGFKTLFLNATGNSNTAMGYNSLWKNSTGNFNTGIGQSALFQNTGSNNTGIGVNVIQGNSTGSNNVGLGYNAGVFDMNNLNTSVFDNSVFLGANSKMHADGETNQIVIGYNAIGNGSNTIQLGNTSISNVKTSGTLTTGTITLPNTDGTSGQVLSTNGSGSVGWANSTISGINIDQTNNNVAIGNYAGQTNQAANSVAIGNSAGQTNQGTNAIAIGNSAGQTNQGTNAIAIGNYAGNNNQQANSIILNATGSTLDATSNSGFFVSPIRSNISSQPVLTYDTTTNEISSNSAKTFVINHPTKPDSYLVHACLEGPEAGVYYRGEAKIENNKSVSVSLPDYVSSFAGNFSIQITPIYSDDTDENIVYSTSRVKDNAFTVHGKNGSFYWLVYAQRGKIEVEPKKSDVQVGGDGPYKYIKSSK